MEPNHEVIIREFYGDQQFSSFPLSDTSNRIVRSGRSSTSRKNGTTTTTSPKLWTKCYSLKRTFCEIFLPQGYPSSVTDDYLEYQIWDTAQAFCSSITGALATEAVLKGVGVGDKSATALAATMTWLLRDGAGMVGRIIFAWLKGTELDSHSKQWRLMADILNDFAIFVDFLAPIFKPFFTLFVCFSSCCRAIVGVAGGATRAALTQHQARRNNLADVSAKDGSQETLVNLSGLICSLLFMPLVSGRPDLAWPLFFCFTFFHLFANYKAVRCLRMDTFNRFRFRSCLIHYLLNEKVLTVKQANELEPVLPDLPWITWICNFPSFKRTRWTKTANKSNVIYGASLSDTLAAILSDSNEKLNGFPGTNIKSGASSSDYFLSCRLSDFNCFDVRICFKLGCSVESIFKAAFEAELLAWKCETTGNFNSDLANEARKITALNFDQFLDECKSNGWDVSHCLLNIGEFRYSID